MKLATWNVNSLKIRLPQLLEWLPVEQPDVVCLQETKTENAGFPEVELQAAGYAALYSGQKTYNGVAILSRQAGAQPQAGIPGFADEQKRVLAATVGEVRVVCIYAPNGQAVDSDKYRYKLAWYEALTAWLKEELVCWPKLAVLGDFNIAPEDRDVCDPVAWAGQVLVSEPERAAFKQLQALGLADGFRLFEQAPKLYSWWDYRQLAFQKNQGLRIDHILLSPALASRAKACRIDKIARKRERPSDHAPVVVEVT
ncbi:MAG: exodeoxyribonuclease III [Betaproteobacteria bacterium]|nr:exodeoxyribonuclease III [Betaproteobacteria bacterium]